MTTSKFFVSTLIAAAAMTATAYAEMLDDAVLSIDSFTQENIDNLTTAGWSISNITGTESGIYTTTGTQGTISAGTTGVSLTTNEGNDRYVWSAIFTVDASVFTNGTEGILLGGTTSGLVGVGSKGGNITGAWQGDPWDSLKIENPGQYAGVDGKVTIGIVYNGEEGTTIYVGGTSLNSSALKGSGNLTSIGFYTGTASATASYSNLYWFNSELSSETMGYAMTDVTGTRSYTTNADYYYWNGTAEDSAWTSTGTNWLKDGATVSADSTGTLVFDGAANKAVAVNESVSAGTMVIASDYAFNVGSGASLSAANINFVLGAAATLNLAGDMTLSSALSGSGTLKKTGTGAFTFSGSVASGATLEIAEGTVTIDSTDRTFDGNLVVGSGTTVVGSKTDTLNYNATNSSAQSVTVAGTLELNNRWTVGTYSPITIAGGTITGVGQETASSTALDYYQSATLYVTAGNSKLDAIARVAGEDDDIQP